MEGYSSTLLADCRYEAVVGESITLTCNTNHTTTVVWSRSDDPVNSNSRITSNGGILTFHSVLLTDAGSYRCYAGNELGLVQVDVELVVRGTSLFSFRSLYYSRIIKNRFYLCKDIHYQPAYL